MLLIKIFTECAK